VRFYQGPAGPARHKHDGAVRIPVGWVEERDPPGASTRKRPPSIEAWRNTSPRARPAWWGYRSKRATPNGGDGRRAPGPSRVRRKKEWTSRRDVRKLICRHG